jgi:hypothetical protein
MTSAFDAIARIGAFVFGALFLWEGVQCAYGLARRKL